jgi:hypothetical protein
MPLRPLIPFTAAAGALILLVSSICWGDGLRAAFMEVGAQSQLPLESAALGIDNTSSSGTRPPPVSSPAVVTRTQRGRLARLQAAPAVKQVRGDYKYWT